MSSKHKKRRHHFGGRPPEFPPVQPFTAEQVLRDLQKVLETKNFTSMEQANEFLTSLGPEGLAQETGNLEPAGPKEQAQDLAYDAMEAETEEQALELARRALRLDPDCVDALVTVADITASSGREHVKLLEKAVHAGERSLGKDFFREHRGHFWGMLETRPYMRARFCLGELLRAEGRIRDAMEQFEALLELNPNDNQGVRDHLLGTYLFESEPMRNGKDDKYLVKARDLLEQYRDDGSAVFHWARALERVLSNDFRGAARQLKIARSRNRHVEEYVSLKKVTPNLSEYYSPGDENEACHCMYALGIAWFKHPQAFFYLQGTLGEKAGQLPDFNELEGM